MNLSLANPNLVKEFIENLIEERDFLCWQLSNANELISEEMFQEIENEHFAKHKDKSQEQLNLEAEELFKLIGGEKMEVTTVAAILNCDYESASKCLLHIVQKIESERS